MKPGMECRALLANRKGAPTGVTGGLKFSIKKEYQPEKYLLLGFTNPILTYINISVSSSCTAENGYDNAEDDSHKRVTAEGYFLEAVLVNPKEGGDKRMIFTISDREKLRC